MGAGEMAQHVRAIVAPNEDPALVPHRGLPQSVMPCPKDLLLSTGLYRYQVHTQCIYLKAKESYT